MKTFTIMLFACALSLAACGGKKPDTTVKQDTVEKNDDTTATKTEPVACAQEVALECPEGQIDGCLKQPAEGETHACVAK